MGKPDVRTAAGMAAVTMLLIAMTLAGCASKEVSEPSESAAGAGKPAVAPPPARPQPSTTKPSAPSKVASKPPSPFSDPNNLLSKRTVYFDFDQYVIKEEFKPLIQAHAKYLSEHPSASIVVEGNCDDRGSREYNLGLGQRRAEAIRKAMTVLGASDRQIEAVSFGKEKPVCEGEDETCRGRNRRGDIRYAATGSRAAPLNNVAGR